MTPPVDLRHRFDDISSRLQKAESSLTCTNSVAGHAISPDITALYQRYVIIHNRLAATEHQLRIQRQSDAESCGLSTPVECKPPQAASQAAPAIPPLPSAASPPASAEAAAAVAASHGASAWQDDPPSSTQRRLAAELDAKGVVPFRFLRVVGTYYDHSLEWRRECLGAPSVFHLCKSMVMHNTKAADAPGGSLPRYFLVILQYAAAVHAEKLKRVLHRAANRDCPTGQTVGKQYFNPRLVPEEVSDQLTGFQHNAVSPIGLATDLPIIMSDRVAALQPPVFWLGGGEADLKVCMPVHPFVEAYRPTVVDCTDDKRTIVE